MGEQKKTTHHKPVVPTLQLHVIHAVHPYPPIAAAPDCCRVLGLSREEACGKPQAQHGASSPSTGAWATVGQTAVRNAGGGREVSPHMLCLSVVPDNGKAIEPDNGLWKGPTKRRKAPPAIRRIFHNFPSHSIPQFVSSFGKSRCCQGGKSLVSLPWLAVFF